LLIRCGAGSEAKRPMRSPVTKQAFFFMPYVEG